MTQQHPITPPTELVQQWDDEGTEMFRPEYQQHLATRAAQWGADQELEACIDWMKRTGYWVENTLAPALLAARRPKPPSLKEQALEQLDGIAAVFRMSHGGNLVCDTIRRALEALPDD